MSLGSCPTLAAMLLIAQGVRPAEETPQARDPGPPGAAALDRIRMGNAIDLGRW
jgi:hypothetical protein